MNMRISRHDDGSGNMNLSDIEAALELDARDEMSPAEVQAKDFTEKGIIPNKVASTKANSFGLRHAYFDVWKPVDTNKSGVWLLQKDADGSECIVRADSE
jgi:hypothetical protein